MKLTAALLAASVTTITAASDDLQKFRITQTYWSAESGYNEGKAWIGSEDARYGHISQITYVKPEPRWRYKSNPAQAIYGVYYIHSRSAALDGNPPSTMDTFGIKLGARYWNEWIPGINTFFDIGWGLAYSQRTTQDLPNQINSSPFFGIGTIIPAGNTELILAIRWHHISNAATNNDNQGFNAIQYTIGVKF
jgi:hypothetical protein